MARIYKKVNLLDNIDVIFFDFGNVLLNLNIKKFEAEYKKLKIESLFEKLNNNILFDYHNFETGKISEEVFFNNMLNVLNNKITKKELVNCWNTIIGEIKPNSIKTLKKLKIKKKLFILSNTNKTHIDYFLHNTKGAKELFSYFDKLFLSYEIGYRKPNKEIYTYCIKKINITPNRVLFIDDLEENINTAKSLGINTIHFNNIDDISKINFFG